MPVTIKARSGRLRKLSDIAVGAEKVRLRLSPWVVLERLRERATMADEEARSDILQTKDIVVLIPLAASTMALTWEIGSFVPTGGFYYFSVSEHLVSALRALPIAVLTAIGIAVLISVFSPILKQHPNWSAVLLRSKAFGIMMTLGLGLSILAIFRFKVLTALFVYFGVLTFFVTFVIGKAPTRSATGFAVVAGITLLITYAVAADSMRGFLNNSGTDLVELATKTEKITGKIIMSGERGVLILRKDSQTLVFVKADEVKSVQWQRSNFLL
jgi:hypothetical protein